MDIVLNSLQNKARIFLMLVDEILMSKGCLDLTMGKVSMEHNASDAESFMAIEEFMFMLERLRTVCKDFFRPQLDDYFF